MNQKLLSDLIGKEIPVELLNDLVTEGRVKFTFKPTSTSAVSQPGDQPDIDSGKSPEDQIDDYINSVKDNEDMIKLLEDMRDDMLAGMNIPPANNLIADAARKLGSADGSITKQVFDTAETILDTVVQNVTGIDPVIAAITGNGTLTGDFLQCHEVTKAIADSWNVGADNEQEKSPDELHATTPGSSVSKSKDAHDKKTKGMARYIFRMLWWNLIWGKLVIFFIEMLEKLMAVPIDTPFLIFRFFKKLTKKNYQKYGPIHQALNKVKITLLCRVPKRNFPEYEPDEEINVYYKKKLQSLKYICSELTEGDKECDQEETQEIDSGADEDWDGKSAKAMRDSIRDTFNRSFPDGEPPCVPTNFGNMYSDEPIDGPGMSPNCLEAAKTIIDAVQTDAMYYSEYESFGNPEDSLKVVLEGSIRGAKIANEKK